MTSSLPAHLLYLFNPGPPLAAATPADVPAHERTFRQPLTGLAAYVNQFEEPTAAPVVPPKEPKEVRLARKRKEREERNVEELKRRRDEWKPSENPKATEDAFKTLFVGRLNYDVSETKLRREFEVYGAIKKISMVFDKAGKPRGYAFVEFENERDMQTAYRKADGIKIEGRRIVVDVERGRTVKTFLPRRLGGGLGGTRRGPPAVCDRTSGREQPRDEDREKEREKERDRDRDRDRWSAGVAGPRREA
eukprot:m.76800 g.76800  ORF g.76800 m.76800 type:complete len:249 (+) comp7892_c2_seq2:33-779(+)